MTLRFNPCQYKKYPNRPWPFYEKPFVMREITPFPHTYAWFAGFNNDTGTLSTKDRTKAVRVSAEQAGYLADKRGYETYLHAEIVSGSYLRRHDYIDVRRWKSSPNRIHPLTIREFLMVRLLGIKLRNEESWDWSIREKSTWLKRVTERLHGRVLHKGSVNGRNKVAMKKVILGAIQPVKDMLNGHQRIWAKHAGQKAVGKSVKDHVTDEE